MRGPPGLRPIRAGVLLALLCSCTVPVPPGDDSLDVEFMSADELRDYSERVFRRHNEVVTRRMMMPPPSAQSGRRRLERAEARMNEACAALNEVAAIRARGGEPDVAQQDRVRRTVRQCDRRTGKMALLMDRYAHDQEESP